MRIERRDHRRGPAPSHARRRGRRRAHHRRARSCSTTTRCASSLAVEPELLVPHLSFDWGDALLGAASPSARAGVRARSSTPSAPFVWPSGSSASPSRISAAREAADLVDDRRVRALVEDFVLPGLDRPVPSRRDHPVMSTNKDLIGRDDVNDLEAILSITNTDVDAVVHDVGRESRRRLHVGLRAQPHAAREALREGEDVAVERVHRPRLVDRRRPGSGRARERGPGRRLLQRRRRPVGHAVREVDREGVDPARHRVAELDALAVPARRAGRVALHRAHRRDRAVDRRQVLRGDPGDGRSPPRRGVRDATSTRSSRVTTRSTRTCACCSTTSSPTAAGT